MKNTIWLVALAFVLSIASVSAMFPSMQLQPSLKDNIVISDSANIYPAVSIIDWLGLGNTKEDLILTQHTTTCGNDCSSEMQITTYTDSPLIDSIRFETLKGQGTIKDYKFIIRTSDSPVEVKDYAYRCNEYGIAPNGTAIYSCGNEEVGSHYDYTWEEYKEGKIMDAGSYYIKLEGKKSPEQSIDWIITSQGQEIIDWAVWNSNPTLAGGYAYLISPADKISQVSGSLSFNCGANITSTTNQSYNNGLTLDQSSTTTTKKGVRIIPNKNIQINGVQLASSSDGRTCYILDSGGSTLVQGRIGTFEPSLPTGFCNITYSLTAGTSYDIVADADGLTYGYKYNLAPSFTINNSYFNWTQGYPNDGNLYAIQSINITGTTVSANLVNASLWTNSTGTWKINQTNLLTGKINSTTFSSVFGNGNYNWTCSACDSDGSCGVANQNRTFSILTTLINSESHNATSYETLSENYYLNASGTLNSANLWFNGTKYAGTINGQIASKSLAIPLNGYGNKSFFWELNGGLTNSSTYYQNILPINLTLCNYNSPINRTYINFSFYDEINNSVILTRLASSTIDYSIDGTSTKTLTLINSTGNYNYPVCFSPSDKIIIANWNLNYYATSYPQRNSVSGGTFTNTTAQQNLYLLDILSGNYVSFQIVTPSYSIVPGAIINATTSSGMVASGTSDGAGIVTFFLDSTKSTTIAASKSGFGSVSEVIVPTQSSYTLMLGNQGTTTNITTNATNYFSSYFVPKNSDLYNNTGYNFAFAVNGTSQPFDSMNFTLMDENLTVYGYSSLGSAITNQITFSAINTGSANYFMGIGCYVASGTSQCFTQQWNVINTNGGSYSLLRGFNDFATYMNTTGIFGLKTGFSLNLLIFLIIFIVTGVMAYSFGLYSPIAVSGMIFVLTFIFDSILGLVANPFGAVAHFPTVITGIILVGLIIKEATSF